MADWSHFVGDNSGDADSGGGLFGPDGLDVGALQQRLRMGGGKAIVAGRGSGTSTRAATASESPPPPHSADLAPALPAGETPKAPPPVRPVVSAAPVVPAGGAGEANVDDRGGVYTDNGVWYPPPEDTGSSGQHSPTPPTPADEGKIPLPCKYFQSGMCTKGAECRFAHIIKQPDRVHVPDHHREKFERAISGFAARPEEKKPDKPASRASTSQAPLQESVSSDSGSAQAAGPRDWILQQRCMSVWMTERQSRAPIEADEASCRSELQKQMEIALGGYLAKQKVWTKAIMERQEKFQEAKEKYKQERQEKFQHAQEKKQQMEQKQQQQHQHQQLQQQSGADTVTLYKDAREPMGLTWCDHTTLHAVREDSPAARYGLASFIGRKVVQINGADVSTLDGIKENTKGHTVITLQFDPEPAKIMPRPGEEHLQQTQQTAQLVQQQQVVQIPGATPMWPGATVMMPVIMIPGGGVGYGMAPQTLMLPQQPGVAPANFQWAGATQVEAVPTPCVATVVSSHAEQVHTATLAVPDVREAREGSDPMWTAPAPPPMDEAAWTAPSPPTAAFEPPSPTQNDPPTPPQAAVDTPPPPPAVPGAVPTEDAQRRSRDLPPIGSKDTASGGSLDRSVDRDTSSWSDKESRRNTGWAGKGRRGADDGWVDPTERG
eukprot:Hpha_TRINITY_DN12641_c0_g1::TRINITY_DN12641_c0_g1_i1::g.49576::m.49576